MHSVSEQFEDSIFDLKIISSTILEFKKDFSQIPGVKSVRCCARMLHAAREIHVRRLYIIRHAPCGVGRHLPMEHI